MTIGLLTKDMFKTIPRYHSTPTNKKRKADAPPPSSHSTQGKEEDKAARKRAKKSGKEKNRKNGTRTETGKIDKRTE